MIAIIMDGIRDTGMIADYADIALHEGDDKIAVWFAQRAKERLAELRRDWTDVEETLGLKKHDDDLVDAMRCHIHKEIEKLHAHIEKM
jgi:hypothetical protein